MEDLFVKDLERKFGDTGYAFWFKTLELIGNHGEKGRLEISWSNYLEKLHKRRTQVELMLNFCSTSGKLSITNKKENLIIECKKFAEYSDNYTKYGQKHQSNLKEGLKQEEEVEEEVEEEKDIVTRKEAATVEELLKTDFILRCKNGEFDNFVLKVKSLCASSGFTWTPVMKNIESDLRSLIYKLPDEKKIQILTECLNVYEQRINWPEYVYDAIRHTIAASKKTRIISPYKFILSILQKPAEIISSKTDGQLSNSINNILKQR
jgi:hypothetical protein